MLVINKKSFHDSKNPVTKIESCEVAGKTVWDVIPKEYRESDAIVQVIFNGKELDDEELKKIRICEDSILDLRIIPTGGIVAGVVVSVALSGLITGALTFLTKPPKKTRGAKQESPTYGFDTPQLTTANGTPIAIVYGRLLVSGQLLNIKSDVSLTTTQTKKGNRRKKILSESILNVLIGFGEGGEIGYHSIAGVAGDVDAAEATVFKEKLFINDNSSENYDGILIYTRRGKSHQALIPIFEETTVSTASFDSIIGIATVDPQTFLGATFTDFENVFNYSTNFKVDKIVITIRFDYLYIGGNLSQSNTQAGYAYVQVKWKKRTATEFDHVQVYEIIGKSINSFDYQITIEGLELSDIDIEVSDYGPFRYSPLFQTMTPVTVTIIPISYSMRVVSIFELINDDFSYPGKALLAVQAAASEQLHGAQFNVSAVVEGILVRVYTNTSTYSYDVTKMDNPAWIILDYLTNARYGLGKDITHADCDIQSFIDAAAFCNELVADGKGGTEKRFTLNISIDSTREAWVWTFLLLKISQMQIFRNNGKYALKPEKAGDPIMQFNQSNMFNFSFGYTAPRERLNYIEMNIHDEDNRFREATVVSLDQTITDLNKYNRQQPDDLIGITRRSQALRYGNYLINSSNISIRQATWESDIPAIRCQPGDIVEVANENVLWGLFSGRVKSSTTGSIALDKEIIIEAGKTYKIRVWHKDGTNSENMVASSEGIYNTVAVTSPWSTTPIKNEVYSIGEIENVTRRMRIIDIQRPRDMRVKITAVEYDPAIYSDEIVNLESLPAKLGFRSTDIPPDVTNLKALERSFINADGTADVAVEVSFTPPFNTFIYSHANIWIGQAVNGIIAWNSPPAVSNVKGTFGEVRHLFIVGETYYIAVTSASIFGAQKDPEKVPNVAVTILGKSIVPFDVQNFRVTRFQDLLTFTWSPVVDRDVITYEIRYTADIGSPSWESAAVLATNLTSTSFQSNLFFALPDTVTTEIFFIKAKDRYGNYSFAAAEFQLSVDPRVDTNIVVSRDERNLDWPGSKTNLFYGAGVVGDRSLEILDNTGNGVYETPEVDLGTEIRSFVSVIYGILQTVASDITWDDATFTWDSDTAANRSWAGPISSEFVTALVEARYDNVTPITTNYAPLINEEREFRYAQFRITFGVTDISYSAELEELLITIDVLDRIDQKQDQALIFVGSPITVTFNEPFTNLSSISLQVTAKNLGIGEFFTIETKTLTNFSIAVRNSSGSILTGSASRTIDYIARGY